MSLSLNFSTQDWRDEELFVLCSVYSLGKSLSDLSGAGDKEESKLGQERHWAVCATHLVGVEREVQPEASLTCLFWYGTSTSHALAKATPGLTAHSAQGRTLPHRWGLGIRRESLPPMPTHLDLDWTRVSSWLSRNGEKGSGLDSNATNSALSYQIFVGFSFKKMFFFFTGGLTLPQRVLMVGFLTHFHKIY